MIKQKVAAGFLGMFFLWNAVLKCVFRKILASQCFSSKSSFKFLPLDAEASGCVCREKRVFAV